MAEDGSLPSIMPGGPVPFAQREGLRVRVSPRLVDVTIPWHYLKRTSLPNSAKARRKFSLGKRVPSGKAREKIDSPYLDTYPNRP